MNSRYGMIFLVVAVVRAQEIHEAWLTDLDMESPKTEVFMLEHTQESSFKRSLVANAKENRVGHPLVSSENDTFPEGDIGDCGTCHTHLKKGDTGNITSPGFPDPYPENLNCLWLLQTEDDSRIELTCQKIHLEACGPLGRESPKWNDYLIISPLWTFRKSYVYCGHSTYPDLVLKHTSYCDKMAISFRSNEVASKFKGFHCTYKIID